MPYHFEASCAWMLDGSFRLEKLAEGDCWARLDEREAERSVVRVY